MNKSEYDKTAKQEQAKVKHTEKKNSYRQQDRHI